MTYFPPAALTHLAGAYGIASIAELERAGLSRRQIESLRSNGSLVAVLRGVYRMPAVPETELARCLAVCRAHPVAAISGPTAGRLWGFRQLPPDQRIHATFPPRSQPSTVAWLKPYRTAAIDESDLHRRSDGIVVTGRIRTAADLARSGVDRSALGSILEQAMSDGRHSADDVRASIFPRRSPGRPWAQRTLDVLGDRVPGGAAESHAEFLVGEALRRVGVTGLVRQHRMSVPGFGNVRFDLAVPELRWAIEVDVFPTHHESVGRHADIRRDSATGQMGWITTRLTARDVGPRLNQTAQRLRRHFDRLRMERAA